MRMMRAHSFLCLGLIIFGSGCGAPDPETTFVARAGGLDLTVEEVARVLAPSAPRSDEQAAALTVANLWVDYVLLGAALGEDETLAHLDLGPLAEERARQEIVATLRDSIIRADASISEAELRRRYEREAPGSEIRTRQILFAVSPEAAQPQVEGARAAIEALRTRIVEAGEDFETLAREHSQDRRSAERGGDMGFFGRGATMPPFEEAAYALEPGEVSEPVQTADGWHIIRLEERRTPTLAQFRQQMEAQALARYLDDLEVQAAPRIDQRAAHAVRSLARNAAAVRGQERDTLIHYDGGGVTAQHLQQFLGSQSPEVRSEIANASSERILVGVLRPLVRQQLLDAEVRRHGLEPTPGEIEAEAAKLRQLLHDAGRELGLLGISDEGGGRAAAVDQAVREVLAQIAGNQRQVFGLGPLSNVLRQHYAFEVRDDRMILVAGRLGELRRESEGPAN
jgi:peptidyl-prolyl cis-trans isomerase C